ncbi:MAG: type 4a pilus biogenesis protein PilO [Candidatus Ratteibacteria bacterium]
MEFLQKHKLLLIVLLTLLFAGAGIYLDRTLSKQANALTKEINARQEKLKGYYSNTEAAPSLNLVNRLTRDKITLEGNYESVSSRYALVPVLTLPEGEIFPALYYKETLYLVLDDLRRQSASKGIALSSLGIVETGLPPAEQVPGLLVLLDTVKRLSEEVFKSKISSLDSVQIGTPSVSPFYIEIPLAVTVSGSSSRLAYFFENLGSSQTIFVLEKMAMVGTGGNFQASLSLKRILWGKDLVDKIKFVTLSGPKNMGAVPGMPGRPGMPGGTAPPPPPPPL